MGQEERRFFAVGGARQGGENHSPQTDLIGGRFGGHARPPFRRLIDDEGVVEHRQRLHRPAGDVAGAAGCRRFRGVEDLQERIGGVASDPLIQTAASVAVERADRSAPFGLRRVVDVDARAPHRRVELAGDGEDRIADRFGVESAERSVGKELVERIDLRGFGGWQRHTPEGPAHDHLPQDALDRPAFIDEPAGKPVEQLGVRGRGAKATKVVGCGDDPTPEEMVPEPVDHDAGEEIPPRPDRLLGQLEPAARCLYGFGPGRKGSGCEQRQPTPCHRGGWAGVLATDEERLVVSGRLENAGGPPGDGNTPFQSPVAIDPFAQCGELGEGRGQDPTADEKVEQRPTVVIERALPPGQNRRGQA